jgi:hypothetical protein
MKTDKKILVIRLTAHEATWLFRILDNEKRANDEKAKTATSDSASDVNSRIRSKFLFSAANEYIK